MKRISNLPTFPRFLVLPILAGLLACLLLPGCQSGIRVIIAPESTVDPATSPPPESTGDESPGDAEPREPRAGEYWIHYQDWRISHSDLERDIEATQASLASLDGLFAEVIEAFEKLQPFIPESDQEKFAELLQGYRSSRRAASRGQNREVIRQQLRALEESVVSSWSARRHARQKN